MKDQHLESVSALTPAREAQQESPHQSSRAEHLGNLDYYVQVGAQPPNVGFGQYLEVPAPQG